MRINIKITPDEFESDDPAEVSYFFTKLAEASRLGFHKLKIEKHLGKWIPDNVLLISKHRERLIEVTDNPSTMGFPTDSSTSFLEIKHGYKALTEEKTINGATKWTIGHDNLLKFDFLEQPGLLLEGFDDCDFFDFLLRIKYISLNEEVSFDAHPTGGHTELGRGIKKHANRRGIIVGIMDPDMYVPKGEQHNTEFEEASHVAKNLKSKICLVTRTPCHEVENLLPIDIIHKSTKQSSITAVNNLKSLMDDPSIGLWRNCVSLYYDYKKGITESKLKENCTNDCQFEWVEEKYGTFFQENNGSNKLPIFGRAIIREFLSDENLRNEFEDYICGSGQKYWNLHLADWFQEFIPFFIGEKPSNQ